MTIFSLEEAVSYYKLEPHPEGGYYKEIYRSSIKIDGDALPQHFTSERNLATSIYYLLPSDSVSHLHRLKSDEIWYYHYGMALEIHMFFPNDKIYKKVILGSNITAGENLEVIIPAGTVFGAQLKGTEGFCLIGCVVTPGFSFDDFSLIRREEMLFTYPRQEKIIVNLTKEDPTN